MSGLISSLALGASLQASVLSGIAPPEAPSIPSQESEVSAVDLGDYEASGDFLDRASRSAADAQESSTSSNSRQTLSGIDISGHQHGSHGSISIDQAVDGGQNFGIVKATEGTHYTNPHFRSDVIDFIKNDAPVGFYHYARPKSDPEEAREQARHFVNVTGIDKGVRSLPPILDLEEDEGLSASQIIAWAEAFVDEIDVLTGRETMIYTYPSFWRNSMDNTSKFSHLPLWIAHYKDSGTPDVPGGWDDWVIWQYTSSGSVEGYNHDIDKNIFRGSMSDLKRMYQTSTNEQSREIIQNVSDQQRISMNTESISPASDDKSSSSSSSAQDDFTPLSSSFD